MWYFFEVNFLKKLYSILEIMHGVYVRLSSVFELSASSSSRTIYMSNKRQRKKRLVYCSQRENSLNKCALPIGGDSIHYHILGDHFFFKFNLRLHGVSKLPGYSY